MLKVRLANLHYATRQEIIEQVANHLLTQNCKSIEGNVSIDIYDEPNCLYRDKAGNSCAAGCLIDDSEYNKEFEKLNWLQIIKSFPITLTHGHFISELQYIHDREDTEDWPHHLHEFCREHKLKTPKIILDRIKNA